MSRRRNLRRRAERAHRCYDCGENDGRLRLYQNRAWCLSCYFVASASEPRPVTLEEALR